MSEGVKSLLQLKIVAGALIWSVFIYVGVVFFLFMDPDPDHVSDTSLLIPLAGMAGLSVLALPVIRTKLLGTLALPFLSGGAPNVPQWNPEVEQQALQKYTVGTIVGCAIGESVAIYGLVAAFLAQDPKLIVPFAITAVFLMGVQFPSVDGMKAVAAELDG